MLFARILICMMNIHCCTKWTYVKIKKLICLLLCISVACLITYRVHVWLKHYDSLASKMIISAYDDYQSNLPFPLVSVCNINPARGTKLYNIQSAESPDRGTDYEIFSDAFQGRPSENLPENKLQMSIFKLMDKASHRMDQMLRSCKIGQRHCSVLNFTKSILPNGACYTLSGDLAGIDEIQLVLDPQSYDYLVPNQGFVGFRILLHGYGDSLWALIPTAVYAGPTFHTILRAVGLKKIYKQHCTSQSIWASCMHDCMQEMLLEKCHCQLPDCTVFDMMRCGLTMNSMIESLSPIQCRCHNPCEAVSYSVESITQALKSPLLFTHSLNVLEKVNQTNFEAISDYQQYFNKKILSKSQHLTTVSHDNHEHDKKSDKEINLNHPGHLLNIHRKEVWQGLLLQTWAFLREANRTAFEQLRQLSRLLQSLNLDLQTVERAVYKVHRKHRFNLEANDLVLWDSDRSSTSKHSSSEKSNGLCMDGEEHSRMLERVSRLGKEFVRLFRQSILFRDISIVPGLDFHIHLVRLFFLHVVDELDRLANQLLHNDLFSDVTMLDLQRKAHQCKQTNDHLRHNDTSWENQLEQSHLVVASDDIASLQAVLLATDSQFKQLRTVFSKLVTDNRELIETVPIDRASLNAKPDSLTSTEGLVTITIQLTRDRNRLIRLESVQAIYSPIAELLDLIVSGLLLSFLSIFLLNICVSHPNNTDAWYSECCCCCPALVNKSTNFSACESSKLTNHTTIPTPSYINCNSDSDGSSKHISKPTTMSYAIYSDLIPTSISHNKTTMNSVYLCNSHQQDAVPVSSKYIMAGLPFTNVS
ncbi:Acid-sensing ion channel 3 isoform 1 [Schistosoma japonicum]|uniref:Acid-sensing ion channel 3 isoform 1 n=1 Tax=Schistosoma japonicum TaxID=6182 RepID=A0A4Z2CVJ7_SCHJA|nr:Acid-sensing ion channel 3 isoform 1 [Schistosoma japonicum]